MITLATGRTMPFPDHEVHHLLMALGELGVEAVVTPWGSEVESDLVVVKSTWDYFPLREDFVAWARSVPRLTNPAEVIGWNSHKAYLLDLAGRGVPVIPTKLVPRGTVVDLPPGEIVVKPAVSGGAMGTLRGSDLAGHLAALTAVGDAIVQPYLPSIAEGEVSLVFFGGAFSHAVRKVPADGEWRVQHEFGGRVVEV